MRSSFYTYSLRIGLVYFIISCILSLSSCAPVATAQDISIQTSASTHTGYFIGFKHQVSDYFWYATQMKNGKLRNHQSVITDSIRLVTFLTNPLDYHIYFMERYHIPYAVDSASLVITKPSANMDDPMYPGGSTSPGTPSRQVNYDSDDIRQALNTFDTYRTAGKCMQILGAAIAVYGIKNEKKDLLNTGYIIGVVGLAVDIGASHPLSKL